MASPWIQEPGGEWRQMDQGPQIIEDPGELQEAQAQAQVSASQLSQTESAYLRQLQYGQASVQRQMATGQIRPQQGMQMLQAMGQQAQPLRIRASQLPLLMRRLQFAQLQRNMAHQETVMQQNANFRARSLQDRITTVNGIQFMETQPGQFEPLPAGLQRTPTTRPEVNSTQILDIANRFQRDFRDRNSRDATSEETQAHVNSQLDLLNGVMGRSAPPAAPARTATTGGAPPATPPPTAQVQQGIIPPEERQNLLSLLDQVDTQTRSSQGTLDRLTAGFGVPQQVSAETTRAARQIQDEITEARTILNAHRGAIPPERMSRFREIMQRLSNLQRTGNPNTPNLPEPTITPPASPPPPREPRIGERGPAFGAVPRF